jgi:hypothetical protein
MNETSLVAYDFRELHKKLELKIIKNEHIRDCLKWPIIQILLIEIIGVKS